MHDRRHTIQSARTPRWPGLARALSVWGRSVAPSFAVLALALFSTAAPAQLLATEPPEQIQGVGVEEKLGLSIPGRLTLTNADGETLPLSAIFDGDKPVVVAPVYFGCPVVCPLILERLTNSFRELDYTIGEDFEVLVFSINPAESTTEANAAKMRYSGSYTAGADRDEAAVREGWHFATADETTIAELTGSLGWQFKPLSNGEFSHPTAVMIAAPDGTITRYIYGFDFPAKQMKLSLLDASEGKIAESLGDRILHYCYRFDPSAGAYTMEAMAVMRVAGVLTVIGLIILIGGLFAWERATRGRKATADQQAGLDTNQTQSHTQGIDHHDGPNGSRAATPA